MPKTAWAARTPAIDASRVLLIEVVINFVLLAVVRFFAEFQAAAIVDKPTD